MCPHGVFRPWVRCGVRGPGPPWKIGLWSLVPLQAPIDPKGLLKAKLDLEGRLGSAKKEAAKLREGGQEGLGDLEAARAQVFELEETNAALKRVAEVEMPAKIRKLEIEVVDAQASVGRASAQPWPRGQRPQLLLPSSPKMRGNGARANAPHPRSNSGSILRRGVSRSMRSCAPAWRSLTARTAHAPKTGPLVRRLVLDVPTGLHKHLAGWRSCMPAAKVLWPKDVRLRRLEPRAHPHHCSLQRPYQGGTHAA